MRNIIFNLIFVPFVVFIATGPISAFADEQVCKKGELAIKGPDGSTSNVTIKYCKDSPDGNWQLVCGVKDPDIAAKYSGECRNGLAHGKGTAEGRDKYVGEFREGNKHGVGVYTWPKVGQQYHGEFRNDKRTGKGTYTWPNGDRYEGELRDGRLHGKGIKTWANGTRYDGEWRDDEFSGGFGTLRMVRGDTGIQSWERTGSGKWIGSNYVVQGLFDKQSLTRACASPADCMEQENRAREQAYKEYVAREKRRSTCQHLYQGRVFKRENFFGHLNYIVIGFSPSQGRATVRAEHDGSMSEVACTDIPD